MLGEREKVSYQPEGHGVPIPEKYLWYRPRCSVDKTGLDWQLQYKTYDPTTHELGVLDQEINFGEHGIQNPALARVLVGTCRASSAYYPKTKSSAKTISNASPGCNDN